MTQASGAKVRRQAPPRETGLVFAFRRAFTERELLWNLTLRDLRSRYRRSVIGWAWSMINPAVMTAIYTFVFTVFFRVQPTPGVPSGMTAYAFYLLGGLLPWNALVNGVTGASAALVGGGGLMSKVRFAREHLVLATVLAMAATLLLELVVLAVMELIGGYFVFHLAPVVVLLVVLLMLFIAGVGLMVAALNLRYRDVQHVMSIGFLVWFYLTPVIYPVELIPQKYSIGGIQLPLRSILGMNPMSRFVLAFRNCLYDVTLPGLGTMVGLTAISLTTFLVGYRFFIRRAPWFVEEL
jgi:ABC-type polysaccharide/polyol phosphate export permease